MGVFDDIKTGLNEAICYEESLHTLIKSEIVDEDEPGSVIISDDESESTCVDNLSEDEHKRADDIIEEVLSKYI